MSSLVTNRRWMNWAVLLLAASAARAQHVVPAPGITAPSRPISGIDCDPEGPCCDPGWDAMGPIPFNTYGPGQYTGQARLQHVPEYRLRVDDQLEFVFRLTRIEQTDPYKLNVGDEIRFESVADPLLNRDLVIQPDGTITVKLLGQVHAARRTVTELTTSLDEALRKFYRDPAVTITPLKVNTKLEDLRATVDSRQGFGGQKISAKMTPEGTVGLPAVGSVFLQGLTLTEAKREIDARYNEIVQGIEVTPILTQRAPRFAYVVGEVRNPGRFVLEGPTTSLQAIALAGGWNVGGNLRQVVVFRRGDDWRLMATILDLRGALYGKTPCPTDEIWLDDQDVVIVPKSPVLVTNDWISLVFTRGLYGVLPFGAQVNFTNLENF